MPKVGAIAATGWPSITTCPASPAPPPSVVIGHIAGGTNTIRVGAGGIMLPNHAPLVIAEQFGTLAALYPGRIDLGVGRAPGTDQRTALALRRTLQGDIENFPQDVLELIAYLGDPQPGQPVRAIPGAGHARCRCGFWARACLARSWPPRWACLMPSPRISRPEQLDPALELYRAQFRPSRISRQAVCDAGPECGRGRHRRGSATPVHLAATGLRQSAHRPSRPVAAAGRQA